MRSQTGDRNLGEVPAQRKLAIRIMAVAMAAYLAASNPFVLSAQPPQPGPDDAPVNGPLPIAQDDPNAPPPADPPSRAARLGLIEGNVTFQPGGVDDWVPATLNRPIATGDRLWADAGARAELHLGSAIFRIGPRTNFTFVNLTDSLAQVQVSSGSLNVRVRRLEDQESVEVDTPQSALTLLRPGEYRIDVTEQGDATIATVRGGDAEIAAGGQVFPVHALDQVRVMEENGQPVFDRRTAPVADPFDNWCSTRDRREDTSPSARYVPREMPGYADLDDHGVWNEEPGYGMVWAPRVEVGWAPYHYGHWAWIEPWGWTWVDDAPWGYAPFHYGRWAYARSSWFWVPGPVVVGVRPVYAPALVGWVGGAGFGVSIGVGVGPAVGWFPLGPREVWVPPYRYSPRYITQVNVTNTVIVNRTVFNNVNVTNVTYVNRGIPGGMTAVPQGAMVAGRPIAGAAVAVSPAIAARAQVGAYAAVAPQRGAVLGGRAPSNFAPPAAVANRTFVARNTPPPSPLSFNQRQSALQQNPGQPLNQNQFRQIQQSQPQSQSRPAFRSALPQQSGQSAAPGFGSSQGRFGQQPAGGQPAGGFGQQTGQQNGSPGRFGGQTGGQPGGQPNNGPLNSGGQPGNGQPNNNQPGFGRNQSGNPNGVGGNPPGGPGGLPAGAQNQNQGGQNQGTQNQGRPQFQQQPQNNPAPASRPQNPPPQRTYGGQGNPGSQGNQGNQGQRGGNEKRGEKRNDEKRRD